MTKKNLFVRLLIMLILIGIMVPSFAQRLKNESENNDVMFALNYNQAEMLLSPEELDKSLAENAENGVGNALINEEDLNSLISAGQVTGIKYNVLCHKYDDESEEIVKMLQGNKRIHNDSYLIITKRPKYKEFLEKWVTSKYSPEEYFKITTDLGADLYLFYDEVGNAWQMPIGFNEEKIEHARQKGLDVILSMVVNSFSETGYVEHIADIVDKYDIKFINLNKAFKEQKSKKIINKNVDAFCKLIKDKGLYVILTEDETQLSNQKPNGYDKIIESAGGRVLRGYETVDYNSTNSDAVTGEMRYQQIINSVVDRNIRFVEVNQLTNGTGTFSEKSKETNLTSEKVIKRLNEIGYNTHSYDMQYDYSVNRRLVSAAAMVLMIIMCLTLLEWALGKKLPKIEILAVVGALLSIGFTYVAPIGLVQLYPTLFAVVAPCFMITAIMVYVRAMRDKLSWVKFMVSTLLLALIMLALCGIIQSSLLSGLDYYLNSIIFRGIKLSLTVPIVFAVVVFAMLFMKKPQNIAQKALKVLNSEIKVYWVIVAGAFLLVVATYIIRSGNVASISSLESFMRNAITELMTERPRTKEFLVGWPCFVLFLYYIKNTRWHAVQWIFAAGSSILFASVINSFCHVFTSAGTIYMRVMNGILIGAVVSAAALIINEIVLRIIKKYFIKDKA